MAKKNKWIQKAVNPKHKGFCTPLSKKTCTPARKAFARRAKAGKLQTGGPELADFGQHNPQSVAGQFPVIDANFDPLDQMGPHAESQDNVQGGFINTQAGQKMQARYASKYSPYIKDFNQAATAATNIGNAISDKKLKRQEYLQTVKSLTPKFMTNTNQGGLNNAPAYTMLGGDDRSFATMEMGGELDYMMVGGQTPGQHDYSNQTAEDRMYEGIAHNAFYGDTSIYAAGGSVSSDKAKEILRDGTVHGHPLTDRQKRYFGWIAGGKKMMGGYQTGGQTPPAPQQSPEAPYQASATLSYYKDKLNAQLKAKNPQAYGDYFKGLQGARTAGQTQGQEYVQNSQYNDYLTPDEVKKALGSDKDYQNYLNSLKAVNEHNVSQGQQPLYGTKEGENDPSKLNYGRRFASLQVTPEIGVGTSNSGKHYNRSYTYNPQTGQVDFQEAGDTTLRPQGFVAPAVQQQPATASRQYGGPRDIRNERESFSYYRGAQTGGYAVGDEVELSAAEIAHLKKQGYKVKFV